MPAYIITWIMLGGPGVPSEGTKDSVFQESLHQPHAQDT